MKNKALYRTATIVFVDLIGSSDAASFMDNNKYDEHLNTFKDILKKSFNELSNKSKSDIRIEQRQGDQGFFLFISNWKKDDSKRSENGKEIETDVAEALKLSLLIKYNWLLSEENLGQIGDKKKPYEIAIGINTGTVCIQKKQKSQPDFEPEGYAINLAKRIEGESRKGSYSKIFVGENTYGIYSESPGENPIRFQRQKVEPLKGIAGNIRIYELIFANIEDDLETGILKIPTRWSSGKEKKRIRESLPKIKRYYIATQDSWLANVYCSIIWNDISELLNKKRISKDDRWKIKVNFEDIISTARWLVKNDPKVSVWKIYLGQMVLDYLKYHLKILSDSSMSGREVILVKDTVDILESLGNREPYELDAKLTLGRFYLEMNSLYFPKKNETAYDSLNAIDQFQRILIWDEEHEEAHYYLSAALVSEHPEIKINKSTKEAEKQLKRLSKICCSRYGKKNTKLMFEKANEDPLFKPLETIIKKVVKGLK